MEEERRTRPDARDLHRFRAGTHARLSDVLGAHRTTVDGAPGVRFAVWAPGAREVSVIGDFNRWERGRDPLLPLGDSGVFAAFVRGVGAGALYKYRIESRHGGYGVDKADPFAFRSQTPPETASIVWDLDYAWGDQRWMATRGRRTADDAAVSIYEMHLGSWRRPAAGLPSYRAIADELIPYLLQLGFTHVEFLPAQEHPFYGSWGYQSTGYYAATSRYGTPQELMALVDRLHQHGIGAIFDWVPSHFPADEHGLGFFDGTRLYEHADPRLGYHRDWSSLVFDYGRPEVRSFLVSSALFWLERFHADALRVDAVASMLYRDYSRPAGEWIPNEFGGRENLEAVEFLRQLNGTVHAVLPDARMIAEESTSWPGVSHGTDRGGLGFDLKWDLGFMHDTLGYMRLDPIERKHHHRNLTFRPLYATSERFVLPLSHDEVVYGKRALVDKMPGDPWQKFANLRALFGYMYAQQGKKLLFMGAELGQWREWSHERELDWFLLDGPLHAGVQRWVADLNRALVRHPSLHELDFADDGFCWMDCADAEQSVIAFVRRSRPRGDGARETLLFVANFTPVPRHHYRIGTPVDGTWLEVLNSDAAEYGGSGSGNQGRADAVAIPYHGQPFSLLLNLPPLSTLFLRAGLPASLGRSEDPAR